MGWVTADFHQYDTCFDLDRVRTVTVTLGDEKGKVHERLVSLPFLKGQLIEMLIHLGFHTQGMISTYRNNLIKNLNVSVLAVAQPSQQGI